MWFISYSSSSLEKYFLSFNIPHFKLYCNSYFTGKICQKLKLIIYSECLTHPFAVYRTNRHSLHAQWLQGLTCIHSTWKNEEWPYLLGNWNWRKGLQPSPNSSTQLYFNIKCRKWKNTCSNQIELHSLNYSILITLEIDNTSNARAVPDCLKYDLLNHQNIEQIITYIIWFCTILYIFPTHILTCANLLLLCRMVNQKVFKIFQTYTSII